MHKSIWERRSLFTSESRTDSCTFYTTQSCDVTQPITRPLPHSAFVTMMNLTQNPLPSYSEQHLWWTHLLTNRAQWQLTAERSFLSICVRFGRPPVSNTLWLSLHMPGLYVSTWTTQMTPSTCSLKWSSAHVSQCFDDLGVVFACLSIAQ